MASPTHQPQLPPDEHQPPQPQPDEQPPPPPQHSPSPEPETQPSPEPQPTPDQPPPLQKQEPDTEFEPQSQPTPMETAIVTVSTASTTTDPPMGVPILIAASSKPASPRRGLPPPCWTPDETSVLIDSYREKWYALRRGNLRAAHWQEVADEIHARCPDVTPPKTAIQCRHKMEKLRKRYRADLNRAKSIPHHRFSSSWMYFSKMDAMEKGGQNGNSNNNNQIASHSGATAVVSPVNTNVITNATPLAVHEVYDVDDGEEEEDDVGDMNDEDFSLRSYRQPRSAYYQQRNGLRVRVAGNNNSNSKQRSGGVGGGYGGADFDDSSPNPNPNYGYMKGNYSNKSSSSNYGTPPPPSHYNGSNAWNLKSNYGGNYSYNSSGGSAGMGMSYMNMSSGAGVINKKKRKMSNGLGSRDREEGAEKGEEAAMEMVEAIRMLGEGFVRMEKMKLEMMRETERMRMEMEMKRTEMLLESQHRIVEAFAKGWTDVISNGNNNDQENAS